MTETKTPRIAITAGEPAGIGPDLCILQANQLRDTQLVVIADPTLLQQRTQRLNMDVTITPFDPDAPRDPAKSGEILVMPANLAVDCTAGKLDSRNSAYVLEMLSMAVKGCQNGLFDAMVTAPVHKGIINEAGIPFSGHTELLAELTNTPRVVMMLATDGLRVALATTHLPLAQVPAAITTPLLTEVITILHNDLQQKFGIEEPRILIAGLNPHAGENGYLGREEIDIIEPVLHALRDQGMNLSGPLPADTLFNPSRLEQADAVMAMYHDQGLPVLKYKGFNNSVNVTLGLSIIRTSVDHGTALDLAGTGLAHCGSLNTAISYALQMIQNR
ncbi:MAG: 4-hydroxythreonine-4-phosphate dehydrogenase PdxA [Endozoicomonadaceae bacterium]|nr:4-hydroxythreonine-4-phosphate dehydrogenase PdxA [Endozoicomonadaceae bacterium]